MNTINYKELIENAIESDIMNGTRKLDSINAIISSDSLLTPEYRQELFKYQGKILIDVIRQCGKNILMEKEGIDKKVDDYNKMIDGFLNTKQSKNKYNFSQN